MKKIFSLMLTIVLTATFLQSCYDTEVDNPYANPNYQSQIDKFLEEQIKATIKYGTVEEPISIDEAQQLSSGNDTVYIKGYVVGYVCGTKIATGSIFEKSDTVSQAANVLIAADKSEKDYTKCLPVQLPTGKIRTAANLKDNPNNFGQEVVFGGLLQTYFSVLGIKNTFYVKINGQETGGVVPAVDNNAAQPIVTEINETFAESMGDFRHRTISEDSTFDIWTFNSKYGMVASAYANKKNYASEAWLISPPVDLTGKRTAYLTFDHAANYFKTEAKDECQVLISLDSTSWELLQIANWPANDFKYVNSGVINLSQYAGQSRVRIALKYTSTAEKAGTWEVKNVKLTETEPEVTEPEVITPAAPAEGDGTKENPYNVTAIQSITNDEPVWIKGYIVGFVPNTGKVTFSADAALASNIAIAAADTVKSVDNSTAVQLPSGDIRKLINLADNPTNLLKEVLLYGKIESYFGFAHGIKEVTYAEIGDKSAGVDPTAAPVDKVEHQFESANNTQTEKSLPYENALTTDNNEFSIYTVSRAGEVDKVVSFDSQYGLKITSYNTTNYDAEVFAISPKINLTNVNTVNLTFSHAGNYFGTITDECFIQVSDNLGDDPEKATWTTLAPDKWFTSFTFVDVTIDLSSYIGKTVNIAFHYKGTTENAGTWEIKDFKVSSELPQLKKVIIPPATTNITTNTEITMTSNEDADIYYTTDGTAPSTSSTKYTGTFKLDEGEVTIKAIAVKTDYQDSEVTSTTYTVEKAAAGVTEVTFTAGTDTGTSNGQSSDKMSKNDVTIDFTSAATTTAQYRIYKSSQMKISVPEGKTITKIVFTCTANGTKQYGPGCFVGTGDNASTNVEGYTYESDGKTGTWTGETQSLTFTAVLAQVRATSIVVSYK